MGGKQLDLMIVREVRLATRAKSGPLLRGISHVLLSISHRLLTLLSRSHDAFLTVLLYTAPVSAKSAIHAGRVTRHNLTRGDPAMAKGARQ